MRWEVYSVDKRRWRHFPPSGASPPSGPRRGPGLRAQGRHGGPTPARRRGGPGPWGPWKCRGMGPPRMYLLGIDGGTEPRAGRVQDVTETARAPSPRGNPYDLGPRLPPACFVARASGPRVDTVAPPLLGALGTRALGGLGSVGEWGLPGCIFWISTGARIPEQGGSKASPKPPVRPAQGGTLTISGLTSLRPAPRPGPQGPWATRWPDPC
jgi:hypothetical protein